MRTTSPANHQHHSFGTRIRVVLATENQGKVHELRSLISDIADVIDLKEFDLKLPEETGKTFAENAIAKAAFVAQASGLIAIADDSGLEVDALQGLPGVRTARYAGEHATDAENRTKMLSAMNDVPDADRGARFVSVVAIVQPGNVSTDDIGTCNGSIARVELGENGFGYDSIFLLPDGRTMAELSAEEKNAISHRGEAMRAAVPRLRKLLQSIENAPC
ncbi:MAG: RdgB/HAM1 family non-canonical purine NTP pyrophosphatase [Thermomicrobiales bacterium]